MAEWDVVSQTPAAQDPWSVVSESPTSKRIEDAWSVVDQRPLASQPNQGGSSAPPAVAQPDSAAKSGLFERAWQTFKGIHPVAAAAGEGAAEKFGAPYLGEWMQRHEPTAAWASQNPGLASAVSVAGAPIEIPSKLFNAAIGAYKGGVTEAGNQLGVDTSRFARDTAGMAEYAMQQPQHMMRPAPPRAWTEPVRGAEPVRPIEGEVIPPRNDWVPPERSSAFEFKQEKPIIEGGVTPSGLLPAPEQPGILRSAAQTAEKIFSPETVDKNAEAAVATIRAATGKAARDTATTDAALEPYRARTNALTPEENLGFVDYVETRSKPDRAPTTPELQPVADALREAYQLRRDKLEALPEADRMGFVKDYYTHNWQDPKAAQAFLGGTKEGSGRFTKKRTIPTIADGIRAGLIPKFSNPIDATIAYVTNADRFIATQQILEIAKEQGHIKHFAPGKQPEGWMEINGRLGQSSPAGKAYAPEGWARIYNNYVSRGFHDIDPALGDAMTGARRVSNSVTALELGLSGYHAFTMAQEAMVNQLGNALSYTRHLQPVNVVKSLLDALVAPVTRALRGKQVQDAYLGKDASPEARQIADLLEQAGGRAKGMRHAPDYEFSGQGSYYTGYKHGEFSRPGSYFDALKKGTLVGELASDAWASIKHPIASTKFAFKQIGRVLDTVAQPLFEKYIPLVKNGAFFDNMSAWLKQNPDATPVQQKRAAQQVWDSIDNRFGEMVSDNVFWNKAVKEIAMLSLRSWSWTVGGSFRELGGGIRDFARAPFKKIDPENIGPNDRRWTQKMDYVIALPIVYGAMSAVVQGLMAKKPIENGRDLLAPQTGGTDANSGEPERLLLPGYMKDIFGFYAHPWQEMKYKAATAPTKLFEVLDNKNWRGDPIRSPRTSDQDLIAKAPEWLKDYWKYTTESFGPITVRNLMKGQKDGSAIPWPLAAMGTRTAPRWLMDPEGYDKMMQGVEKGAWTRKERFEKRDRARYGGTE